MRNSNRKEHDMVIDCDSCVVRGLACGDCVVSVLLGAPPNVELDASEQRAIDALGRAGIVPRLRLEPIDKSA
jgi:ferredoxin